MIKIVAAIIFVIVSVLILYPCCIVASRSDDAAEQFWRDNYDKRN